MIDDPSSSVALCEAIAVLNRHSGSTSISVESTALTQQKQMLTNRIVLLVKYCRPVFDGGAYVSDSFGHRS